MRAFLDQPEPLIITKSSARSLVHRRAHMDYVGVKTFDAEGAFNGEHRFVGLFTSSAYSLSPRDIPLLRRKIDAVMARAGLRPASHDGKALAHILDTFPRDELFQISEDELFETAMGILQLGGRPKVQAVPALRPLRPFRLGFLFAPRDHVTAKRATKIHALLAAPWMDACRPPMPARRRKRAGAHPLHHRPQPGPAAPSGYPRPGTRDRRRDHDLGRRFPGSAVRPSWPRRRPAPADRARAQFRPAIAASSPPMKRRRIWRYWRHWRPGTGGLKVEARAYRKADDAHSALRLKLYVLGDVLPLSVSLPVFENLGLKVIAEDAYPVHFKRDDGWTEEGAILDFLMERADGQAAGLDDIREPLQDVFHAVLGGQAESDGFNRLVIGAGLDWRDVAILRTVAKFLRQAAFPFSQDYMEQALARNPEIAALLSQLFHARLDPKSQSDADATPELAMASKRRWPMCPAWTMTASSAASAM